MSIKFMAKKCVEKARKNGVNVINYTIIENFKKSRRLKIRK